MFQILSKLLILLLAINNIYSYEEKSFVVIIPSYNNKDWYQRNLDSVFMQKYNNFRVIYVDDCSNDGTGNLVENYIKEKGRENKVTLIKNKERFGCPLANFYYTIHTCKPDDIIINLDGDDFLENENVISYLNTVYQDPNVWFTYGQFKWYPTELDWKCSQVPDHIINNNTFRDVGCAVSHLRSFYAALFQKINKNDLFYEGKFYPMAGDTAMIYPLLEMAGKHSKFLSEVLYVYNNANPLNEHKLNRELQTKCSTHVVNKKKYQPLDYLFDKKSDLVITSYNRPLQLYALLESIQKYITNLGEVHIIYRADAEFESGYEIIKKEFPTYIFKKQCSEPQKDFKPLIMDAVFKSQNDYIMFAVDDIIIKDFIDISQCINALQIHNAYGFYLRLGKNITQCYVLNIPTPVPDNSHLTHDIFSFKFSDGKGDWAYPNTVDMTIYKKSDIKNDLEKIPHFYNPTYLEGWWATFADLNKTGLFFEESKIVNIPLNIVTRDANNKNMAIPVIDLLNSFNAGLKININIFQRINNKSPHMEYKPEFIKRN